MIRVPPFDLKFLNEFAAAGVGTSNRRHEPPGEGEMARLVKRPIRKAPEPAGHGLAERIVTAPLATAPADAPRKVTAWLNGIARTAAGRDLKRLIVDLPRLRALAEGIADGSPYLWELASGEPARLAHLLQSDPDAHLERLLAE